MLRRYGSVIPAHVLLLVGSVVVALASGAWAVDADDFARARALRVQRLLQQTTGALPTNAPAARLAKAAAGDGGITGTVRGLDPEAHMSAMVVAWAADAMIAADGDVVTEPVPVHRAPVEPDGRYLLQPLAAGTYYVSAEAKGYDMAFYPDAADVTSARSVDVSEDGLVEGIDITLEPYRPGEGSIAGRVTNGADGHPVADAYVHAFAQDPPYTYGMAYTDGDGHYVIEGLHDGEYVVEAWSEDYLHQFYPGTDDFAAALLVGVTEPGQTTGIDFALSTGGIISGTVQDGSGAPLSGAYVTALVPHPEDPNLPDGEWREDDVWAEGPIRGYEQGWAVTDDSGAYRMAGLPAGDYHVYAQYSAPWFSVSVWYDGVQDFAQSTPVTVIADQETPGIDLVLHVPALDGVIGGRVTDAQGHPVAGAQVAVQDAVVWAWGDAGDVGDGGEVYLPEDMDLQAPRDDGGVVGADPTYSDPVVVAPGVDPARYGRVYAYAQTDLDGRYAVKGLPAGTYLVSAGSQGGWEYVQRWYVDAVSPVDATPVELGEGERREDIDIVLPLRSAAASISGTVHDQDGAPLTGAFIEVSPADGASFAEDVDAVRLWAYGHTDEEGAFQVDRLPAGSYLVHASYSTGERYGQGWYGGAATPAEALPVVVAEGEQVAGIDMRLEVRPIYGVISGTVTDAATGAALERAYVELVPVGRDVARSAPLLWWRPSAVTDASGAFRLDWIPEGAYSLTVYANGGSAQYVPVDATAAEPWFKLAGGDELTCDVAVPTRHDGDGAITGTVAAGYGWLLRVQEPMVGMVPPAPDGDVTSLDAGMLLPQPPEVAVVFALPLTALDGDVRYTAVTAPDGTYALRGLAPGDYVVMCTAPGHIGVYYDGAYAPDRAQAIRVDGGAPVMGIDFLLEGVYRHWLLQNDDVALDADRAPGAATGGVEVFGHVADAAGRPVESATVYLLNAADEPVAFAQTGSDGTYELSGVGVGEYRVFASKLGFAGTYNGNEKEFAAAAPLALVGGQTEVNLVLNAAGATAVEDEAAADGVLPQAVVLYGNYPNPFNPSTRIAFTVPEAGRARLWVYNQLGQQVAAPFDALVVAGQRYEVDFQAQELSGGTYFYTLEFQGQRLTRPMSLLK